MKKSTINRLIRPTLMCMLGIVVFSLFSAFMFYFGDGPRKLVDFLVVFSPEILLLIFLFVAWRWQLTGGTILIITGLALIIGLPILYVIISHDFKYFLSPLFIACLMGIPIILSGILFRKSHFQNNRS